MSLEVSIRKRWGDFTLDMDFRTTEKSVSLLGASGCGKSMTLKCIAGIEEPFQGKIVLNGRVLFDRDRGINLPPQQRKVGYLFQNYALFPNMTLKKNIMCCVQDTKSKKEKEKKAEEILERFGLRELADLRPQQLSGGQQQRGALARILATDPQIMLLDEPMSALDGHLREQMTMELMGMVQEYGKEMILVTHNMKEAYRMSEQTILMENGKKIADGKNADIFKNPRTRQGAIITGFRNIVPIQKTEESLLLFPSLGIEKQMERQIPSFAAYAGILEKDIILGCRKEDADGEVMIHQVLEGPKDITYSLQVCKDGKIMPHSFLWYVGKKDRRYKKGEKVWFCFDAERITFFSE